MVSPLTAFARPSGVDDPVIRRFLETFSLATNLWVGDGLEVGPTTGKLQATHTGIGQLNYAAAVELTIASGAVTATQTVHSLDTEADAATDDLDTINGGVEGHILVINAINSARTVVLKHGTGNIICPGGVDFSLDDFRTHLMLIFRVANWHVFGSSFSNVRQFNFAASTELTIATGAVTTTQTIHSLDTEADAATDDLDTINGGVEGDVLIINAANSARTVVVKHGTGNIICPGAVDLSLDEFRHRLTLDRGTSDWYVRTSNLPTTVEGAAVLSTGEIGGAKFLREDGDGSCSFQALPGGGDALVASALSQFAATTSAQLAGVLSDETGSGLAVFATSPTLTTPVLGTPTSGTLTNCTAPAGLITSGTFTDARIAESNVTQHKAAVVTGIGQLNYAASVELTIASGVVTATQTVHSIDTESDAVTDDLDTINGGSEGDSLIINAINASRTVVLKHGTGNILTASGTDISLDFFRHHVELIYRVSNWHVVGSTHDASMITAGTFANARITESNVTQHQDAMTTGIGMLNLGSPIELTIATGAVTVSQSFHQLDTEADAATDDLDTINGGTEGDVLYLNAINNSRDVVIKHNTGNIQTRDGADITLGLFRERITLLFMTNVWYVQSAS